MGDLQAPGGILVFLIGKRNESRHFGGRIGVQAQQKLRKSCRGGDSCVSLIAANLWWSRFAARGSDPGYRSDPPTCNYELPNGNPHPALTGADAALGEHAVVDWVAAWE